MHQYKQHIIPQCKTEEHDFSPFVEVSQESRTLALHIYFETIKCLQYDSFSEN